jgi:hypothetical protein
VGTLAYNFARFGSPLQFGYNLIPGVLDEPWYREGIFALSPDYWARNAYHMFLEPWRAVSHAPWWIPSPWGGSIFLFSPFLILALVPGRRPFLLAAAAWLAIFLLIAAVFSHGNPGGWQISYRYAIPMLPWALVLLASRSHTFPRLEVALIVASIAINAFATIVFLRTDWMTP